MILKIYMKIFKNKWWIQLMKIQKKLYIKILYKNLKIIKINSKKNIHKINKIKNKVKLKQ